jgi:hypothetical protein
MSKAARARSGSKDEGFIDEALELYEKALEHHDENFKAYRDDIAFSLLEEQWPEKIRKDREREARPCLTINKLAPMGRNVVNDARKNKPGIQVHPVDDGSDPDTAEVFNGIIRNIEQSSGAMGAYVTAFESSVFGGFGYFKINTKYANDDTFDQDIVLERIANTLSVVPDCYSQTLDSSDWNFCFVTEVMTKKQFKKQYPKAEQIDFSSDAWKRAGAPWSEGDTVQVAEYWVREPSRRKIVLLSDSSVMDLKAYEDQKDQLALNGIEAKAEREVASHKVTQYVISGAEVLETIPWAGVYIPIVPVYGSEITLEGKRYFRSLIRSAKDSQQMFNYWRTTSTEMVAMAPKTPFIGRKGAFETDAAKWATANTQNHAYIEYDGPEQPARQPFVGVPAGMIQEALNASDDIKATMGIYDASLGARSNETSGKAIVARQMEADTSTFHFIDNLGNAISHAGRILVDLIPKVYSVPRIVRIVGKDGDTDMKPINQPVMERQKDPETGEVQEIQRTYDLTVGRYDLTVSAGPSFASMRQEAATQMMELIRSYPDAAPLIGDLLVKNLDWPGAEEIAERLKNAMGPAAGDQAENPQAQQAAQQMQQMQQVIQSLNQQLEALKADKSLEAQKVSIQGFDAETKRIATLAKPSHLPGM